MKYFCCDDLRRQKLLDQSAADPQLINGIDFLEVLDDLSLPDEARQRTLFVYFLFKNRLDALLLPEGWDKKTDKTSKVRIEGGTRIRGVQIEWAHVANSLPASAMTPEEAQWLPASADDKKRLLVVRTNSNGDFSRYTLRIVQKAEDMHELRPPAGFDPILSAVEFSFKARCPSDFDCRPRRICPGSAKRAPEINYLAKDYASFRQLMFDRMALTAPGWQERNPADIGVTLVEWLSYIGDQLSYAQDAVATEAYLATARRRTSVRRHARLVDYAMHDGCNARTWVHVEFEGLEPVILDKGTPFLSRSREDQARIPKDDFKPEKVLAERRILFESMHDAVLCKDHNTLSFYTWGDTRCCLPAGATRATLKGHRPELKAGDVLIFNEVRDPQTGRPEDADPAHRHAVLLTHVVSSEPGQPETPLQDALYGEKITEIEWAETDALPFPLCISAKADEEHGSGDIPEASLALGNNVLADHGLTRSEEKIKEGVMEAVPARRRVHPQVAAQDRCQADEPAWKYPRFRPALKEKPLTFRQEFPKEIFFGFELSAAGANSLAGGLDGHDLPAELKTRFEKRKVDFLAARLSVQGSKNIWSASDGSRAYLIRRTNNRFDILPLPPSAASLSRVNLEAALPGISLTETDNKSKKHAWSPVRDLLESRPEERHFAVEVENDGTSRIRFGDDVVGARPDPGSTFDAKYRIGNGTAGNIGAGALAHVVSDDADVVAVTNPLPAQGGTEPETIEQVREKAPFAFRRQERAVTADDYAEAAKRHPSVQNAVATYRWTGSWHSVFLTVDRKGGLPVDKDFQTGMRDHIERFRLAGYDVVVDSPRFVSLEIEILVCVKPGYFRENVKEALLEVLSGGRLADGRLGVFHPDRFSFGQPVYLSRIYEAVLGVAGVQSAVVKTFQRQDEDSPDALEEGKLVLGRLEIARLENDPNYPDHGVLRIEMGGGQ